MVAVVQLVEHQVVILAVAGSSPVSHPQAGGHFALPPFAFEGTLHPIATSAMEPRADLNWVIQLGPRSVEAHPGRLKPMAR